MRVQAVVVASGNGPCELRERADPTWLTAIPDLGAPSRCRLSSGRVRGTRATEITLPDVMTGQPEGGHTATQAISAVEVAVPRSAVTMRYEVTIRGEPGETLLGAFSDVTVRRAPALTVLSADLDQAALHGLLARIADLGIDLLGVRLVARPAQPGGDDRR